jgi:hypothetical protein
LAQPISRFGRNVMASKEPAMRAQIAMIALLACLLGPPAVAATPSAADEAAIQTTITRQLDAFRHDDAEGAFALAAPTIQGLFGTSGNFLAMVQKAYPPVYRPKSYDFTSLTNQDGDIVQMVELIGPDGLAYTARYTMEQEADGSWRISACQLLESRRLGV